MELDVAPVKPTQLESAPAPVHCAAAGKYITGDAVGKDGLLP